MLLDINHTQNSHAITRRVVIIRAYTMAIIVIGDIHDIQDARPRRIKGFHITATVIIQTAITGWCYI